MTALITPEQRAQLLANGARFDRDEDFDPLSVLKLVRQEVASTTAVAGKEVVH